MPGGFPTFRGLGLCRCDEKRLTDDLRAHCERLGIGRSSLEALDVALALYRDWRENRLAEADRCCA